MKEFTPSKLRTLAACLAIVLGVALVGSLWHRELSEAAVAALLQGSVYLFIALGLLGRSRLTLYIGLLVPATCAVLRLDHAAGPLQLFENLALLGDVLLSLMCALTLWRSYADYPVPAVQDVAEEERPAESP